MVCLSFGFFRACCPLVWGGAGSRAVVLTGRGRDRWVGTPGGPSWAPAPVVQIGASRASPAGRGATGCGAHRAFRRPGGRRAVKDRQPPNAVRSRFVPAAAEATSADPVGRRRAGEAPEVTLPPCRLLWVLIQP